MVGVKNSAYKSTEICHSLDMDNDSLVIKIISQLIGIMAMCHMNIWYNAG